MDVGGTSLDVCVVDSSRPSEVSKSREIDLQPIALPMLNVHTVGAGGGSVISIDHVGRVKVGPQSMGAIPGPACYDHGGTEATLTDVNVTLGLINPATFANGEVPIYPDLARRVITEKLAAPLRLTDIEAAKGAYRVATNQMADAIQKAALDGGNDARRFVLVAFGGGGPLHACAVAKSIGIPRVLIPAHPGLFSARGIALSSFYHDYAQSIIRRFNEIPHVEIEAVFRQLEQQAEADLSLEEIPREHRQFIRTFDMRYLGQSSEINVPLTEASDFGGAGESFHELHEAMYSYRVPDEPIELVNVRLRAIGHVSDLPVNPQQKPASQRAASDSRLIHNPYHSDPQLFSVYHRFELAPGQELSGPAIIEEPSSSTLVLEHWRASVDSYSNLILESFSS
jgi:N-methylhydantoinase A